MLVCGQKKCACKFFVPFSIAASFISSLDSLFCKAQVHTGFNHGLNVYWRTHNSLNKVVVLNILPISLNKLPILKVCTKDISKVKCHKDLWLKPRHQTFLWVFPLLHDSLASNAFVITVNLGEGEFGRRKCGQEGFKYLFQWGGGKQRGEIMLNRATSKSSGYRTFSHHVIDKGSSWPTRTWPFCFSQVSFAAFLQDKQVS